MRGAVAQSVRAITKKKKMKPEQINQIVADVRSEADACYLAHKNVLKNAQENSDRLKHDAARLYSKADKIWAARIAVEAVLSEQMKIGFPYEPDALREKANEALERLINGGFLG